MIYTVIAVLLIRWTMENVVHYVRCVDINIETAIFRILSHENTRSRRSIQKDENKTDNRLSPEWLFRRLGRYLPVFGYTSRSHKSGFISNSFSAGSLTSMYAFQSGTCKQWVITELRRLLGVRSVYEALDGIDNGWTEYHQFTQDGPIIKGTRRLMSICLGNWFIRTMNHREDDIRSHR